MLLYNTAGYVALRGKTHFMGKKESVIYFTFVVLLIDFFKYASLYCNLIKFVNILSKYASREQKRF